MEVTEFMEWLQDHPESPRASDEKKWRCLEDEIKCYLTHVRMHLPLLLTQRAWTTDEIRTFATKSRARSICDHTAVSVSETSEKLTTRTRAPREYRLLPPGKVSEEEREELYRCLPVVATGEEVGKEKLHRLRGVMSERICLLFDQANSSIHKVIAEAVPLLQQVHDMVPELQPAAKQCIEHLRAHVASTTDSEAAWSSLSILLIEVCVWYLMGRADLVRSHQKLLEDTWHKGMPLIGVTRQGHLILSRCTPTLPK